MSPKKKKRPGTAQQLIDSLLDERTPAARSRNVASDSVRLVTDEEYVSQRRGEPRDVRQMGGDRADKQAYSNEPVLFDNPGEFSNSLALENRKNQVPKERPAKVTSPSPIYSAPENEVNEVTMTVPGALGSVNSAEPAGGADRTIRIDEERKSEAKEVSRTEHAQNGQPGRPGGGSNEPSLVDRGGVTELKTVVRKRGDEQRHANSGPESRSRSAYGSGGYSSAEAQLKQSESLRIAQGRMSELEAELERLRRENEKLASAGETLGRRADELLARSENLDLASKEAARIHEEERRVFRGQIQQKDRENAEMRTRLEEMEGRLESNFKKIRVRERELEHRLEIVRMESATLVITKDKMLLDLKRQIDQLTHENDYSKQKSQELYNQYKDKQETARRVVRALRIALTILEGEEDTTGKKPE